MEQISALHGARGCLFSYRLHFNQISFLWPVYFWLRFWPHPARRPTIGQACILFWLGVGFLCAAPQAGFFWSIFSSAAIVLWLVFAFWIGLFTAIVCACIQRWGKTRAMWLIPIIWTGLEYFRSELYYLKFSWLNIGYALPEQLIRILKIFLEWECMEMGF
ncbi:MAG: hypothetical protein WDM76_06405 [Limisphaerales bacterium]